METKKMVAGMLAFVMAITVLAIGISAQEYRLTNIRNIRTGGYPQIEDIGIKTLEFSSGTISCTIPTIGEFHISDIGWTHEVASWQLYHTSTARCQVLEERSDYIKWSCLPPEWQCSQQSFGSAPVNIQATFVSWSPSRCVSQIRPVPNTIEIGGIKCGSELGASFDQSATYKCSGADGDMEFYRDCSPFLCRPNPVWHRSSSCITPIPEPTLTCGYHTHYSPTPGTVTSKGGYIVAGDEACLVEGEVFQNDRTVNVGIVDVPAVYRCTGDDEWSIIKQCTSFCNSPTDCEGEVMPETPDDSNTITDPFTIFINGIWASILSVINSIGAVINDIFAFFGL